MKPESGDKKSTPTRTYMHFHPIYSILFIDNPLVEKSYVVVNWMRYAQLRVTN